MTRKLQRKDFRRRPNISEWNALSIGSEAEMVRVFGSRAAARESYEAWKDRPEFARISDRRLEAWWVFHGPPELQRSDDDESVEPLPGEDGDDVYDRLIANEDEFKARRALYVIENGMWPGEADLLREHAQFMLSTSTLPRSRAAWAKVSEALGEGDAEAE